MKKLVILIAGLLGAGRRLSLERVAWSVNPTTEATVPEALHHDGSTWSAVSSGGVTGQLFGAATFPGRRTNGRWGSMGATRGWFSVTADV
jgi:hypothetical protein